MYLESIERLDSSSFNTRELYEELLSIESELDRQMKVNEVRARAKMLGLTKAFDSNWLGAQREYERIRKAELISSDQNIYTSQLTNFSELDDQYKCGEYMANDTGVYLQTDKGFITICPHPIYPVKILRNSETGKYKVELEFVIRGKKRSGFYDREILASPSKILILANDSVQVTSLTAPYLVKYLTDIEALNPELIKEYNSTSRLGWTDYINTDGTITKKFLPYQQEVIFDNVINNKSLFDSIKSMGSRDKWYSCVKEIRQIGHIEVLISIAASFASVLVEPVGSLPFIVSLWGGSGIGKTVILKICTSIWADPGEGKYITDAKATNTAMEIRLNILNSLPMTLDDMAQIKNTYDGDFSELIYRWCAGKGRDRSNKDLGLNKLTSWRNCTITNGERSMVDESTQGGAVNRVIDIESSGQVMFDGKSGNKVSNLIEKNFGYAGKDFVDVINEIGFDKITDIYTEQYNRIRTEAAYEGVEKEDKQIVPMALILTADALTEEYLFKDGVRLDIKKCVAFLKNKGDVSEHERAYEYLVESIAMNKYKFADNEDSNASSNEEWGFWKDENHIVINGRVFDQIISDGNFQSKAFLSWCKKKNLIECDNRGTPKKNVKHNGQVFRAVIIKTDYGQSEENADFIDVVPDELPY